MSIKTRLASALIIIGLGLAALSGTARLQSQDKPASKPALPAPPAAAAKASVTSLSIDLIMKGEEFVGTAPSDPVWAVDGKTLYFRWKKSGDRRAEQYSVSAVNPVPRPVRPEEMIKLPPLRASMGGGMFRMYGGFGGMDGGMKFDKTRKRAVFTQNGDVFLLDLATGKARQLTATDERKTGAEFTADQKKISFMMADNLFVLSFEDGAVRQLTGFTKKAPPADKKPDEIDKWYSDQQKELIKELQGGFPFRGMGMRGGMREGQVPELPRPKPFVIKETQNMAAMELSPDERYVTFSVYEQPGDRKATIVPNYVTRSGYTETIESHPKAAYPGYETSAGVMAVGSGEVKWIDCGQGERKVSAGGPIWSPDGKECILTAQAEDRKDQWLLRLDPATAKTSVILQVHDDAWVGPLGLTNVFWWPDSLHISFISEKDGYAHLYKSDARRQGHPAADQGDVRGQGSPPVPGRQADLPRDERRASGRAPLLLDAGGRRRKDQDHRDDRAERGHALPR